MLKLKPIFTFALILGVFLNLCQSVDTNDDEFKVEGRTKFDDDLRDFVEFLKLQMKCGYEPAGVPPLAPYQLEFKQFNILGTTGSFKGNLSNLVITGLDEFDVVKLQWNNVLQKITFDFNFGSVLAQSSYRLNAMTGMFGAAVSFYGNGSFHLELQNLRAHGSFNLRPNLSGGLTVWAFKVQLDLESSESKTTGIMDSFIISKMFNYWVEEFVHLTFDDNAEGVSDAVEYLVVPALNRALQNISLVELVALIMGLANDVVPSEALC